MVDVGSKAPSKRRAVAEARVWLGAEVFSLVKENRLRKGDLISVAQIAGVMGAKATPTLIPLCHPLSLTHVDVRLHLHEEDHSIRVECSASTVGVTGVEMEALTGACVSALTVYDMCKAASHDIVIGGVMLVSKRGGKADFEREGFSG
ncbi:UNVERIFIED_CONTAM: hypothetical protein GTU68_045066 [Idotea baltica]|nr:hypothetical protein [Idotea baltica]